MLFGVLRVPESRSGLSVRRDAGPQPDRAFRERGGSALKARTSLTCVPQIAEVALYRRGGRVVRLEPSLNGELRLNCGPGFRHCTERTARPTRARVRDRLRRPLNVSRRAIAEEAIRSAVRCLRACASAQLWHARSVATLAPGAATNYGTRLSSIGGDRCAGLSDELVCCQTRSGDAKGAPDGPHHGPSAALGVACLTQVTRRSRPTRGLAYSRSGRGRRSTVGNGSGTTTRTSVRDRLNLDGQDAERDPDQLRDGHHVPSRRGSQAGAGTRSR